MLPLTSVCLLLIGFSAFHQSSIFSMAGKIPEVKSIGGELTFLSADGKNIVFQPGAGGNLLLNGVAIRKASDLQGAPGPKGDKGEAGLSVKGAAGPTGPKGDKGENGKDGTNGLAGPQGPKGDQGPAGAKGASGVPGTDGAKGEPGAKGNTGAFGRDGRDGINGSKGETGAAGSNGEKGQTGPPGINGSQGSQGKTGLPGPPGTPGPPGPQGAKGDTGSSSSSSSGGTVTTATISSTCSLNLVPTCPFWMNTNTTTLPVSGSPILRFSTAGFTELYHPYFEASYTCHFDGAESSAVSKPVPVTTVTDTATKRIFYIIDCVVPKWTFSQPNKAAFTEKVNVSLWFQEKTAIPYAGKPGGNEATFYAGWNYAQVLPSGKLNIIGGGLNTTGYYVCQFNSSTASGFDLHLNSTPVQANSTTVFTCVPPIWHFTSDSRIVLNANVSVWISDSRGKLFGKLPFFGVKKVQDQYTYYRCRDGVTNGIETDVDCGGQCPNLCPSGSKCNVNSDCAGNICSPISKKCGSPGQSSSDPAANCKALSWTKSAPAWLKWGTSSIQTFCNMNASLDGGGWAMVWKHSYFEIDKSKLSSMKTYSSYSNPCLSLSAGVSGWCNVPNKRPSGYTEQMIAAYHKGILVYAYKAALNSQLGQTNYGAFLASASSRKIVDRCTARNGVRPSISTLSASVPGITFDKYSPDNFNANCDTDDSNYSRDCRWENCQLPSSVSSSRQHTQMTVVIYIR